MSKFLTLFTGLIILVSCGGESTRTQSTVDNNQGNSFLVTKCGQISYEQGITGGSIGHYLYENGTGARFVLVSSEAAGENILSQITLQNTPQDGCVYSNSAIINGFEGEAVNVNQAILNP